ncbi:MAG TPA: TIR domain-containing protein [Thermomicrobiales bacterium]|nr:TIR domain-containing protein [Thermomicrobiales bacterium]
MSSQPQVFISYQRADEGFARQVRTHLAAHGVRTWMDQYDIPVGAYWPDEIDKGLSSSDIVVGVLSPDSVESRNVKNEWDWAIQHDKRLVLLQVRPCDIPHRYISINFIDSTGPDQAPAFGALLQSLGVSAALVDPPDSSAGAGDAPIPSRHGVGRGVRRSRAEPFVVGREREQELLTRQIEMLLAGQGSIVLVGGEAGIGKTTLTTWFAWAAEQRDAIVCVGGCYDLTTTPPYGPWVEITRAWPADAHGFPSVPPELRGGDALARVHSQAALFEIASEFFITASAVKPIVLLLEDMHWTDQGSLDLLRYLARLVAGRRLMLIVTYRDDELTRRHPLQQMLPSLIRESNAQRLGLQRLDDDAIETLISRQYPLPDSDLERLATYIEGVTEGNPFFVTEVLHALEEAGTLSRETDGWGVSGLDQVRVPELVRQVTESRLDRLGGAARQLLEVAAVIGHEVDIDLWIEIAGRDDTQLVEVLERAIEARLVEELPGGTRLRFSHALVRETLYAGLVSIRRRAWHRQIGEVLSSKSRPDPDVIATHFQRAADPRASQWLVRAGERAQQAYAWSTAVERYEAALEALSVSDSDPRERGWLQYRIARLQRFHYPRESLEYLDEALRVAAETDDRALAAAARYSNGLCRFFAGEYPAAITDMSAGADMLEALPVVEQERLDLGPDPQGIPTITNPRGLLVAAMTHVGYLNDALRMGEATREATPKSTALAELGWSHYGDRHGALAIAYALLGRVDEARSSFERARRIYRENGHFSTQAVTAYNQLRFASLPYRTDCLEEHAQLVAEGTAAFARSAATVGFGDGPDAMSLPLLYLDGRWDAAVTYACSQFDADTFSALDRDISHLTLALIALARGDVDECRRHIRVLLPAGAATEPGSVGLYDTLVMQRVLIALALDGGDRELTASWLATQDTWLTWSGAVLGRAEYQLLLARYHLLAGDEDAALFAATTALEHASQPRQPLALIAAHRTLGELLTRCVQLDQAAEHLHESMSLAESCAAPFERALTLTALAELDIATNRDPREQLAAARAICERLEARPTLERITALEASSSIG